MFEMDEYLYNCYLGNEIPPVIPRGFKVENTGKDTKSPSEQRESSEEKAIAPAITQNQEDST